MARAAPARRPAWPIKAGAALFLALVLALVLLPGMVLAACAPIASATPRIWRAAAGDPAVAVTFLGHASFLIETPSGVRAVTDYGGDYGPADPPDIVTMNRAHSMHNTPSPDPRIRHVLRGWRDDGGPARHDLVLRDLRVTNLATNIRGWGGETMVNGNSVFMFESAGLCLAHLGHLHHLLLPADLDALGRIDVLMIMVDGGYSLGHRDAMELIGQIHPRIVLPMHYFSRENLLRFLALAREKYQVEIHDSPTVALARATLPGETTIIALPGH